MNITVIGTGYVGLVTGVCLAEIGHTVTCVDNNEDKLNQMRAGETPIFEDSLRDLMQRNTQLGRLHFTSDLPSAAANASAIFLALPTPPQEDGAADLSIVKAVAADLAHCMPSHYCVVINKSTVPVGTAEAVRNILAEHVPQDMYDVASNPEFLREGHAVKDFLEPERIVVGTSSPRAEQVLREIYAPFIYDERPFMVTDERTAELVKYASNTFLVAKINFMNEIAQLCEKLDADVDMVRDAMGLDSRIGSKFLNAGIGAGGSCFPKDVRALNKIADDVGYEFKILQASMRVNEQQHYHLVNKVIEQFGDDLHGKTIAVWGIAFKPHTDDIREAPALVIIDALTRHGAYVKAYDPEAGSNGQRYFAENSQVVIVDNQYSALEDADALFIATEWPEFIDANIDSIKQSLRSPVIFDGRNIFKPHDMRSHGFDYFSIGRVPVTQSN